MSKIKKLILLLLIVNSTSFIFSFDKTIQRPFIMVDSVNNYNLDPYTANYNSEAQVLTALYEGLFSYNPYTLEPEPALAETFQISKDKKTWTITLRNDIFYSDGTPITANEIKRTWLKVLDPKTKAPFASLLDCIKGAADYRTGNGSKEKVSITASNDTTLVIKLTSPTEQLSKILCHHSFSAIPEKGNNYSGPYILTSQNEKELIFEKNIMYYDSEKVAIPEIKIIYSENTEDNTYDFNMGNVDWVTGNVNINKIYDLASVLLSPQFGTEYLFFASDKEPWNNKDVRNALLAAVPWVELRSANYVIADTLILPLYNYPTIEGIGETDLDLARDLLLKSGIDTSNLTLTFAITESQYLQEQAKMLQEAWAKIDVNLEIVTVSSKTYLTEMQTINADLYSYTWIGDFADPVAFLELFRSGSSLKETSWESTAFDSLLEEASLLANSEKRYEKLAEAEKLLLSEGIILPISHPVALNCIDTTVIGGWYPNVLDIHPFKYLYFTEGYQYSNVVLYFDHNANLCYN